MDAAAFFSAAKRLVKQAAADDISGLAAELAYRVLLALFPFFIFLAALGGFAASLLAIDNPAERIMENLRDTLPQDAAGVLEDQLQEILESRNGSLLSFGILGAIWTASGAVNTIIKALNRAYGVKETRPFWRKYMLSLGLTLLGGAFFVASFALVVIGQFFIRDLADLVGVGDVATTVIGLSRFLLAALMLVAATAFLYWAAPDTEIPFRWVTPGAALFIIAWIVFTLLFGVYVSNFSSYNSTYGALGGVVILMVWLYLSSFLMLAGAELNALLEAKMEPESMKTPAGQAKQRRVAELGRKGAAGQASAEPPPQQRRPAKSR